MTEALLDVAASRINTGVTAPKDRTGEETFIPIASGTITPIIALNESSSPSFNFSRWTRKLNQELSAAHSRYISQVAITTVFTNKAKSLNIASLSMTEDEANEDEAGDKKAKQAEKYAQQAQNFQAKADISLAAMYEAETALYTLIGKTIDSMPRDWLIDDAPKDLDFTSAETYDKWVRGNRLAQLVPAFIEARDSKP